MSMQEKHTHTGKVEVGLSIGSNVGNRIACLRSAVKAVANIPNVQLIGISPVYETEPVGVKPEYLDMPYLNAVILLQTDLPLRALSRAIHAAEEQLGRVRTADRFAPRTIDIDILYAGDTVCRETQLTVPHPRWAERRFVLQPLADLRPNMQITGSRLTVAERLAAMPENREAVRRIPETLES